MVLALVPHLNGSFFTPFLDAVSDLLSELGYCVTIGDLRGSGKKEQHYGRALRDGRFAGAILFTGQHPARRTRTTRICPVDIPIVLGCNEIAGLPDLPVFDVDDRKAATRHGCLPDGSRPQPYRPHSGPRRNVEARERFEGYQ